MVCLFPVPVALQHEAYATRAACPPPVAGIGVQHWKNPRPDLVSTPSAYMPDGSAQRRRVAARRVSLAGGMAAMPWSRSEYITASRKGNRARWRGVHLPAEWAGGLLISSKAAGSTKPLSRSNSASEAEIELQPLPQVD
jgi:hypothetical protein